MINNSSNNPLTQGWNLLRSGNPQMAFDFLYPKMALTGIEAFSICILAQIQLGNSSMCDDLTIQAGKLGARDYWYQNQFRDPIYAQLIARLDTLEALKTETVSHLEAWMALNRYWVDGSAEGALYYSIKAIRFFWDSPVINHDLQAFANYIGSWLLVVNFEEKLRSDVIGNIRFSTSGALSANEANRLIELIENYRS